MEEPLDRTVRTALEPSEESVQRVVTRALAGSPEVSGTPWRRWWGLVATAALVAAVLVGFLLWPSPPAPETARTTITNLGEVIVVRSPDGAVSLHSRSAPNRSPRGMRLIVLEGNQP